MVRKSANGRKLEEALTNLLNNQSILVSNQSSFLAQLAQLAARAEERFSRIDERFSRIDQELAEIKAILLRHEHMLQALPEAVRERIGFTPANPAAPTN
jgi:uncharacterized protein YllA (UPF0747 family)